MRIKTTADFIDFTCTRDDIIEQITLTRWLTSNAYITVGDFFIITLDSKGQVVWAGVTLDRLIGSSRLEVAYSSLLDIKELVVPPYIDVIENDLEVRYYNLLQSLVSYCGDTKEDYANGEADALKEAIVKLVDYADYSERFWGSVKKLVVQGGREGCLSNLQLPKGIKIEIRERVDG